MNYDLEDPAALKPPNTTSALPATVRNKARKKNTSKSNGRKRAPPSNEATIELTTNKIESTDRKESSHFTGMKKMAHIVKTKILK